MASTRDELTALLPCEVYLEGDDHLYTGDCGALVVPENRNNPHSRLIALPVTRIISFSDKPLEPIFWFEGGGESSRACIFASKFEPKTVNICTPNCPGYSGQVN
jgi:hypothetical protein